MKTNDVLTDAFERGRDGVRRAVEGLDAAGLGWRPDPDANSIAWLVWHATRVHDDHVADIAGRDQAWIADGWADRFDLPFDPADTGFGHSSEQVGAVRPDGPGILVGYHDAVAERTFDYLATIDAAELDRVVDDNWDPPVTAGVRLVSVINDQTKHLGQADYVRGMLERRRSASG